MSLRLMEAVVRTALRLKGKKQKDFVKAYKKTGKYALHNMGYFSGYYDLETMLRIQKVFGTKHPVWGRRNPTPAEAYQFGVEYGMSFRKASKSSKNARRR